MTDRPAHLPDEISILDAQSLGDQIERAIAIPTSPFAEMMRRAREAYCAALAVLIECDLLTPEGIMDAIRVQAEARRYKDLCHWIEEALEMAGRADKILENTEPAIEELEELIHGRRHDKPAFDA
jgi:hypothetical protein